MFHTATGLNICHGLESNAAGSQLKS